MKANDSFPRQMHIHMICCTQLLGGSFILHTWPTSIQYQADGVNLRRERRGLMCRKKTLILTLVINAIPQGYIEAVVTAALCSNFIHVTYRPVGGGGGSRAEGHPQPSLFTPNLNSEGLSLHLCTSTTQLPKATRSLAACIHSANTL